MYKFNALNIVRLRFGTFIAGICTDHFPLFRCVGCEMTMLYIYGCHFRLRKAVKHRFRAPFDMNSRRRLKGLMYVNGSVQLSLSLVSKN